MLSCRYCKVEFKFIDKKPCAHVRWCKLNPNLISKKALEDLKKARESISKEARLKANEKIKQNHKIGRYINAYSKSLETKKIKGILNHSQETKDKLKLLALNSNHRRILRSTRVYNCKDGKTVLLDSSWEEALAKRLDFLSIKWTRPKPLKWVDFLGKEHNYFPDFYLEDYDLYLDPKNPEVFRKSLEKIEALKAKYNNIRFITTLEECKNFML